MNKSKRDLYPTCSILLRGPSQLEHALMRLQSAPLDPDKPLEFWLGELVKPRTPDQNALMWAGPLKDIAQQAYVEKRTYCAETWHEFFKKEYLPEDDDPDLAQMVKNPVTYQKWDIDPAGDRVLIGSTTDLLVHGFYIYMLHIEAYAASLGVVFTKVFPIHRIQDTKR